MTRPAGAAASHPRRKKELSSVYSSASLFSHLNASHGTHTEQENAPLGVLRLQGAAGRLVALDIVRRTWNGVLLRHRQRGYRVLDAQEGLWRVQQLKQRAEGAVWVADKERLGAGARRRSTAHCARSDSTPRLP